jgi:hypothetical protein
MQHHTSFRHVLMSVIRRAPAGQWRQTAARHWFRSGALVIGLALTLVLAWAPRAARSAQAEDQVSFAAGRVINEITVNAITQKTCAGATCACQAGEIATGGGARCAQRDTLQESFPVGTPATSWQAVCVRLMEIRRPVGVSIPQGGVGLSEAVVSDLQRFQVPPASTFVVCATP